MSLLDALQSWSTLSLDKFTFVRIVMRDMLDYCSSGYTILKLTLESDCVMTMKLYFYNTTHNYRSLLIKELLQELRSLEFHATGTPCLVLTTKPLDRLCVRYQVSDDDETAPSFTLSNQVAPLFLSRHRWTWWSDSSTDSEPLLKEIVLGLLRLRQEDGFAPIFESAPNVTLYKEIRLDASNDSDEHTLLCSLQYVILQSGGHLMTELWYEPVFKSQDGTGKSGFERIKKTLQRDILERDTHLMAYFQTRGHLMRQIEVGGGGHTPLSFSSNPLSLYSFPPSPEMPIPPSYNLFPVMVRSWSSLLSLSIPPVFNTRAFKPVLSNSMSESPSNESPSAPSTASVHQRMHSMPATDFKRDDVERSMTAWELPTTTTSDLSSEVLSLNCLSPLLDFYNCKTLADQVLCLARGFMMARLQDTFPLWTSEAKSHECQLALAQVFESVKCPSGRRPSLDLPECCFYVTVDEAGHIVIICLPSLSLNEQSELHDPALEVLAFVSSGLDDSDLEQVVYVSEKFVTKPFGLGQLHSRQPVSGSSILSSQQQAETLLRELISISLIKASFFALVVGSDTSTDLLKEMIASMKNEVIDIPLDRYKAMSSPTEDKAFSVFLSNVLASWQRLDSVSVYWIQCPDSRDVAQIVDTAAFPLLISFDTMGATGRFDLFNLGASEIDHEVLSESLLRVSFYHGSTSIHEQYASRVAAKISTLKAKIESYLDLRLLHHLSASDILEISFSQVKVTLERLHENSLVTPLEFVTFKIHELPFVTENDKNMDMFFDCLARTSLGDFDCQVNEASALIRRKSVPDFLALLKRSTLPNALDFIVYCENPKDNYATAATNDIISEVDMHCKTVNQLQLLLLLDETHVAR